MCADAGVASSRFSVTQLRIKLCWSQQNAAEQQDQLQLCVLSLWAPCVHSPFLTQFVSYNVTVLLYQNHDAASPVWPDLKKTISPVLDWHCFARCIVHSDFNTEHREISPSFSEWWTSWRSSLSCPFCYLLKNPSVQKSAISSLCEFITNRDLETVWGKWQLLYCWPG